MSRQNPMQVHLTVDPSSATERAPEPRPRPSRVSVLLLGGFSGRGAGPAAAGMVPTARVDRDDLETAMAAWAPSVPLDGGAELRFGSLDDLHPDALVNRLPRVGALLDGREPPPRSAPSESTRTSPPPKKASPAGGGGVLGAILDLAGGPSTPAASSSDGPLDSVRAFAAEAARSHTVREPTAEERDRERTLQERAADELRDFLWREDFRAMERCWRGADLFVRGLDTGPSLQVHLADLPREALEAEALGDTSLEDSALRQLLARGSGPEGAPWTWVVFLDGAYGPGARDQTVLAWVTALCAAHGAVALADGEPALAGIADLDDWTEPSSWGVAPAAWGAFRGQPEAASLGLALPGFLLRDPYGRDTDPVDAIPFEEIPGVPHRDHYLWGPGALACALVLARAAADRERPGLPDDRMGGLPMHAWKRGVETGVTCGAAPMTDGVARRLMDAGLIPVAWARGDDGVRVLVPRSAAGTSLWLDPVR